MENTIHLKLKQPISYYTDVMVDIETAGTVGHTDALLAIAARPFRLETMEFSDEFFDECLKIPNNRRWNEDTKKWWESSPEKLMILNTILTKGTRPGDVMKCFYDFGLQFPAKTRFWCNHTLDWDFITSYFLDYDFVNPFRYDMFRDLHSFLHGLQGGIRPFDKELNPPRDERYAHSAMYDVDCQIQWMMNELAVRSQLQCTPMMHPGNNTLALLPPTHAFNHFFKQVA